MTAYDRKKLNASKTDIILGRKTHLICSDNVFSLAFKKVQMMFEVNIVIEKSIIISMSEERRTLCGYIG